MINCVLLIAIINIVARPMAAVLARNVRCAQSPEEYYLSEAKGKVKGSTVRHFPPCSLLL